MPTHTNFGKFYKNVKQVLIALECKKISSLLIQNCKSALKEMGAVQVYGYKQLSDREQLYYYHPLKRGDDWHTVLRAVK